MKKTDILQLNQYEGQDMVSRAGFNQDNQALETTVGGHLRSKDNPHGVTAAQVGADPQGSAQKVQEGLNTHQQRKDNPHGVTAVQAGALPITGGTVQGNVVANWFQMLQASRLSSAPARYPVLDPNGWLYYRNKADMAGDLGIKRTVLFDQTVTGERETDIAFTLKDDINNYDLFFAVPFAASDRTIKIRTQPGHDVIVTDITVNSDMRAYLFAKVESGKFIKFGESSFRYKDFPYQISGKVMYIRSSNFRVNDRVVVIGLKLGG